MASSSCSHQIFTSFHGPDVRETFLSHLSHQFEHNGIKMFDDNKMERSELIAPTLIKAIRESRISIVLLSKNYASSSWCLDELLEILKCKEESRQIVMTIFHGVDPSDVRKQTGDFGIAFNETCARKTLEERSKWSQALTYVGNIAGEDFKDCKNEAKQMEKIAKDVLDKLNVTSSRDFDCMVGLDAHLEKIKSILELGSDIVKIVGIFGPAGIGKSTIVRALLNQLSSSFPRSCFMDNLRGRYPNGSHEYSLKLGLQGQLLSEILNHKCMTIGNLGMVKYWLQNQKVLIILDDVTCLDQLEVLANIEWFGPGSRILVTTENKEILEQHGITDIYHVGFPSKSDALMIFCQSAFRQTSPPDGFEELANEVAWICGNLPLGLEVLGSSLRGKSKERWIDELPRLKNCLDRRIESALKVGYEDLNEKDKELFLFIAVFLNYKDVDHVTSMLAESNLNVRHGLENLANRCLIRYEDGKVVMHHLLQIMATQAISQQEDWKRKILVDAQQICYVLENGKGNGLISGISFNVEGMNELNISRKAFGRMKNLVFLEVYKRWDSQDQVKLHIPEEMEFPPRLRLLHWNAYPRKSLPSRFCPKNLIELDMEASQLEKLWEGPQPLVNLKKMNLFQSSRLKELPDLSNATNLETLDLMMCSALEELPPSLSNLHKLDDLKMVGCKSIKVIPNLDNLTSLHSINMASCQQLSKFPDSLRHCARMVYVFLDGSKNLKTFSTHLPPSITVILLDESSIERITVSIKDLHNLKHLHLQKCKRLVSLPELPCSVEDLRADDCEALESINGPLNTPHAELYFNNCFKLDEEARQTIIQRSFVKGFALLPGREVPADYEYRVSGNSLTIPHSNFGRFKVCVVLLPRNDDEFVEDTYEVQVDEDTDEDTDNDLEVSKPLCRSIYIGSLSCLPRKGLKSEHLLIFQREFDFIDPFKVRRNTVLQFYGNHHEVHIIECGIQILTDLKDQNNNGKMTASTSRTHESVEASIDDDNESKSGESSDKEEDEEGYKDESKEASDNEYDKEGIADESVPRKKPRKY